MRRSVVSRRIIKAGPYATNKLSGSPSSGSSCGYLTPVRTRTLPGSSLSSCFGISKGLKLDVATPFSVWFCSVATSSVLAGKLVVPEGRVRRMELLRGEEDSYGGVIVEMKEPMEPSNFVILLRASMLQWKQQGKTGVWIKLPIELVDLVEAAVKEGFWYHHAEKDYLMLVYWIPVVDSTIPRNASHRVGIGAFVMNDSGEVLVVQEKSGKFKGTEVWKFPTGVVDEGEDLCAAAIREVKEEASIETEFQEVLAFRQSHQSFFEKSDLFFLCTLRPLSFEIRKQDSEIKAAKWMPLEEYAAQPFVQKHEMFKWIANICLAKRDGRYTGFSALPTVTGFSAKRSYLYLNNNDRNDELIISANQD